MSNNSEKKSKKKFIILGVIAAVVIIGVVATGGGGDTSKESAKSDSPTGTKTAQKTKEKTPEITVDAATIIAEYEANELAADDKYKGKYVEIVGVFESVSDTLSIKTMQLTNGADIMDDNYTFITVNVPLKTDATINLAKGFTKGNTVTVRGTISGYTGFSVDLKNDATILQ